MKFNKLLHYFPSVSACKLTLTIVACYSEGSRDGRGRILVQEAEGGAAGGSEQSKYGFTRYYHVKVQGNQIVCTVHLALLKILLSELQFSAERKPEVINYQGATAHQPTKLSASTFDYSPNVLCSENCSELRCHLFSCY